MARPRSSSRRFLRSETRRIPSYKSASYAHFSHLNARLPRRAFSFAFSGRQGLSPAGSIGSLPVNQHVTFLEGVFVKKFVFALALVLGVTSASEAGRLRRAAHPFQTMSCAASKAAKVVAAPAKAVKGGGCSGGSCSGGSCSGGACR